MGAGHLLARATLEGNQEVGCRKIPFYMQIPAEWLPEVLRPAQIHEGEGCGGSPALEESRHRESAASEIASRADRRPIEKSPHRVVEAMVSYSSKVDVVGQAHDESMSCRSRGNLHEGDPGAQDPFAEHHDVQVERRDAGLLRRLTGREEQLDLAKQVVPDPHHDEVSL